MFSIQDLHVSVEDKVILNGVNLTIKPGEIHAIMGPNGSGKSTLANTIAGHPKYKITAGTLTMNDEDITALKSDKRAHRGVFLAFQYPKEIPGVPISSFMATANTSMRKARGLEPMPPMEFRKKLREELAAFGMPAAFMNRSVNEGFSGGEKKKLEMIQMALLEPTMAVLDETDSGLDVDALRVVSEGINRMATPKLGILIITHYQRILHYVKPHFVHVMIDGKIVQSGGPELSAQLEKEGYESYSQARLVQSP